MNNWYRPLPEPEPSVFIREVFVDGVAIGRIDKSEWGYMHECYGMEMGGAGHETEKDALDALIEDYDELQYRLKQRRNTT